MKEQMTFNQINEQESSAYRQGSDAKPIVLVKRTSGDITVGRLDKDTMSIGFTEGGQELHKKVLSKEILTDESQARLATELAGKALRGEPTVSNVPQDKASIEVPEPTPQDEALRNKAREAADYKYNQVKHFGGTHEDAEAAADRVWKNFGF